MLSGRKSFLGNKDYWTSVPGDSNATAIRREFAGLIQSIDKVIVSDQLTVDELAPWENTRIVKRAEAHQALAALKQQPGRDILIFSSRLLWQDLMAQDLIDELHLTIFPMLAGAGTPLFEDQPGVTLTLMSVRTWQGSGNILACYAISRPGHSSQNG